MLLCTSLPDSKLTRIGRHAVPLGVILLIAAALRIKFGIPLLGADEFGYIEGALNINAFGLSDVDAWLTNIYANRLSISIPLAIFLKVFGATETAVAAYSLIVSLAAIAVAYAIGCVLCSRGAGIIAAVLMAFVPQLVWLSLTTYPDNHIPLYTSASLLCLLLGMHAPSKRREIAWSIASGLCVLLAFQARATCGIMLAPLGLTALWSTKRAWPAMFLPAVTFFSSMILVTGLLYLASDTPFTQFNQFRKEAVESRWTGTGKPFEHTTHMMPVLGWATNWPQVVEGFRSRSVWHIYPNFFSKEHGLFYYLVFPALLYAGYRSLRAEKFRAPLLTFTLLFLFFEFGSTSLTSYQPIWKLARFLTIVTVPGALLVGIAIQDWRQHGRSKLRTLLCAGSLGLSVAVSTVVLSSWSWQPITDDIGVYRTAINRLKEQPARPIYVNHWRWTLRGGVFAGLGDPHQLEFRDLAGVDLSTLANCYVVLDKSFYAPGGEYLIDWERFDPRLKSIPENLPQGWTLLETLSRPRPFGKAETTPVYILEVP